MEIGVVVFSVLCVLFVVARNSKSVFNNKPKEIDLKELSRKYPNDMDLGSEIRKRI